MFPPQQTEKKSNGTKSKEKKGNNKDQEIRVEINKTEIFLKISESQQLLL